MPNQFDRLCDKVTDHVEVGDGVVQLLKNIASEIRVSAGNEAASQQLADSLDVKAAELTQHVLAHVPHTVVFHGPPKAHDYDSDPDAGDAGDGEPRGRRSRAKDHSHKDE